MTQPTLIKRRIDQPIIFNGRAIREDIKAKFQELEFWTCTLEIQPAYKDTQPVLRRGNIFVSSGSIHEAQQEVLNFRDEFESPDSPMTQLPIASLTFVLGYNEEISEDPFFKKLCEITTGEITPETYKALQLFMSDLLLNPTGIGGWFNKREDERWQALLA